jgi:hypothetical protein
LKVDRFVHEMQPTKAEMKNRLAEVRNAALLLRDALNDTPIREFLEIAPLGPIEFRGVFDQMVQELAGRAERAMASTLLSTETGKTKAGRTRAAPPDASSAKLFCSALIEASPGRGRASRIGAWFWPANNHAQNSPIHVRFFC